MYIPSTDAAKLAWLTNFATLISANPGAYGLLAGDAVAIQNARDAYNAAYTVAVEPSTRTAPAVAQKDADRNFAIALCRAYAQQIEANLGVTDQQKLDLGLTVKDQTPTPINPPATVPLLTIIGATSGQFTVRYADQNSPASRGKPFGTVGMQLFVAIDDTVVNDPNDAAYYGTLTKQPVAVTFDPMDEGRTATLFGRWINAKGEPGPWSLPVHGTVFFGGPPPAP